ncbi:MAG TPA: NAD-binding protein [Methanomassiliicoccales archaeon]|nr:NAD-binding protein [Methanomassiliicoccales archaeon]
MMRTIIVGGGRIGKFISKDLDDFVIIEKERIRAENLAREVGEEHVIVGDGEDPQVLEKAGAKHADALLAITNQDRTNLKVALAAKAMGIPRVIARCDDPAYIDTMHSEGVESVICPAQTASRMIHSTLFHDVQEIASIHVTKGSLLDGTRLGDVGSLAKTRVLGVIRKNDVLKPDPDLAVKSGDEVLLCSLGGMSPELRQLMARETTGLLPFSEIVVMIGDEAMIETVGDESLYLAAHLGKIPVEVHYPADEPPQRLQDLAQIWGVPVEHFSMKSGVETGFTCILFRKMQKNSLVAVGPGEITNKRSFKQCDLMKMLERDKVPVLICRRKIPYTKILAVYDGSEDSMDLAEAVLKIALHTGSSLHILDISEQEGNILDLEHLKRLGRSRDIEVKQLSIEGNPTLDLVALVTGGGYSMLAIRWSCSNVRKDILRKVIADSALSVLLVR